MKIKFSDEEVI